MKLASTSDDWYELVIRSTDWEIPYKGAASRVINYIKQIVPKDKRRYIARAKIWKVHSTYKNQVEELITEVYGGDSQRRIFE